MLNMPPPLFTGFSLVKFDYSSQNNCMPYFLLLLLLLILLLYSYLFLFSNFALKERSNH